MAFVPGTQSDDILIPTANGGDYRGGAGNDTYIITKATAANGVIQITDTEGVNTVQLADGLTVTSSSFTANAVELTLSNGSKVQVLGASTFKFEVGANLTAGDTAVAPQQTYAQFASALGVASIPATGSAAGTPNFTVPGNTLVPTFSVTGAAAAAEGTTASFAVSLTNRAAGVAYGVNVALAATGGATAGTDFASSLTLDAASIAAGITLVAGVLTVPSAVPGTSVNVTLTSAVTIDALSPETGEGLSVTLSAPTGASAVLDSTKTAVTTAITDVPISFTLTASAASVFEGAGITYTVTASAPVAADTVVAFSVVPGDVAAADAGTSNTNLKDFAAGSFNPANVTILAGTKTATYVVTALSDGTTELPENYTVKAVVTGGPTLTTTPAISLLDGTGATGQTFTLLITQDNVPGTAGDDTINGTVLTGDVGSATTFTPLDLVDGAAGTDVFNLSVFGTSVAAAANAFTLPTSPTVKNVETLNLVEASDNAGDSITADVSAWAGLLNANVTVSGTTAPLALLTTKGNVTSASATNVTTSAFTDSATTDTLATVSLTSATGASTITSDALKALNLTTTSGGVTVTAAAGTRALTVGLNGVTGGTIVDAEATTLNINSTGTKSSGVTFWAVKATSVTVDAAVATTIADVQLTKATTFTTKGAGQVTVSALTDVSAMTAFDASASTGGLSLGAAIGNAVAFAGGTGKDSVSVTATTKTIALGAGDDTATIGVAALGTGGSVNGGDGTDTLSISAADAATASGSATFAGVVSNFERVTLTGATNQTIDLKVLGNYSVVSTSGGNGLTLNNLPSGATLTLTGAGTAYTVANSDYATSSTDSLNVALTDGSAAAVDFASTGLTAANVETIAITVADTQATPTGTFLDKLTVLGNTAKTITVAGNAGLNLTATDTAATSVDASGITLGGFTFTSGALAGAAVIKGSAAGANTVNFAAATKVVTYTGGTGVDTITGNNAADSITTGAGNDIVTLGTGNNTVDLGAGNDTITLGVGQNTVTLGTGTDAVTLAVPASGNAYSIITDISALDSLTFVDKGTETFTTTKITLAGTAVFQDFIDSATSGDGSTNGAIKWFQFGGNTYIVEDVSVGATFTNGADIVVQLNGLIDLSTATGAGTNVITLA